MLNPWDRVMYQRHRAVRFDAWVCSSDLAPLLTVVLI